jgi:hypothetical protein
MYGVKRELDKATVVLLQDASVQECMNVAMHCLHITA